MPQFFRGEHARAIAALPPGVSLPGESFELLRGPWVEEVNGTYFTVSPLLRGAGAEIWSSDEVVKFHRLIAAILMKYHPLTTLEAAGAFLHAYIGQNGQLLARLAGSLITASEAVQEAVFASIQWFSLVSSDGPFPEFMQGPAGLSLRMLQYKLTQEAAQKLKIAKRFDRESSFAAGESKIRALGRLQFIATMLMDFETRRPPEELVGWLGEVDELLSQLDADGSDFNGTPVQIDGGVYELDPATSLFFFVLGGCDDLEFLLDLAAALNNLDQAFRARLLSIFDIFTDAPTGLVDHCWLREAAKLEPEWDRILELLTQLEEYSRLWRQEKLRQAAVRARSIITQRYKKDPDAAIHLVRSGRHEADSASLDDQEASLLQERGDHAAAWAIWQPVMNQWLVQRTGGELFLGYASRKAAISAAHLRKWDEAARLFLTSSGLLKNENRHASSKAKAIHQELALTPIALEIDAGFCLWHAERRRDSISAFGDAIAELDSLGAAITAIDEYFVLSKVLAQILLVLHGQSGLVEPYVGIASSASGTPELMTLPPTGIDVLWAMLCRLEAIVDLEPQIIPLMSERLSNSGDLHAKALFHIAEIDLALRTGQVRDMVEMLAGFRAAAGGGYRSADLLQCLVFGVLARARSAPTEPLPLEGWYADLERLVPQEMIEIATWMQAVREVFSLDAGDIRNALRRAKSVDLRIRLVAVRATIEPGFSAAARFQAHLILTTSYLRMESSYGEFLAVVMEGAWRQILANPAVLMSPRTAVPEINRALGFNGMGFRKCAALLLSAEAAVRVPVDPAVRRMLMKVRDSSDDSEAGG
jgi:hypothetical protein